jgi:hypothetical protein
MCPGRRPNRLAPPARVYAPRRLYLDRRNRRRLCSSPRPTDRRPLQPCARLRGLADRPDRKLKKGGRTGTGSSSHTWLRSALVVSEIAVALMLLTVSGAFLRSFQKMRAVDPGFLPDHVLVAEYQLPLKQYSTDASADSFNRAVVDGLSSRSGIIAVGITNALPASGFSGEAAYRTEGEPADIWKLKFARFATIYGDYFRAMSIPLLDGRTFTMDDRSNNSL